jgi:hypothetical protein
MHDYIFAVHRCGWDDPVVSQIKFEESAEILAEVGKFLIEAGRAVVNAKHDAWIGEAAPGRARILLQLASVARISTKLA